MKLILTTIFWYTFFVLFHWPKAYITTCCAYNCSCRIETTILGEKSLLWAIRDELNIKINLWLNSVITKYHDFSATHIYLPQPSASEIFWPSRHQQIRIFWSTPSNNCYGNYLHSFLHKRIFVHLIYNEKLNRVLAPWHNYSGYWKHIK